MSIGAKHWALAQTVEGGSSPRIVLFFLADWIIGDDQVECWPSVETLAFETGMNRQTIMKATAALERQGLIEKHVEWSGLRKRVFYRLRGFDPVEWKKSTRPQSPNSRTSEIVDVRNPGCTESRTSEIPYHGGTKSRTADGTKSHTTDGTKSRTGTGNNRDIQGITGTSMSPLAPASDELALTPEVETPVEKEKPKAKTSRRKPSTPCPWDEGSSIPEELADWSAENFPTIDASEEFRKFVGWALSKDMRYARWDQAFRNWMGNALKFSQQRGGNGGGNYRSKRQPTCPGDWENEFKGVDYTRGAVMKEFTPEESARLATLAEEMNF